MVAGKDENVLIKKYHGGKQLANLYQVLEKLQKLA